jgi:hypothetical protein
MWEKEDYDDGDRACERNGQDFCPVNCQKEWGNKTIQPLVEYTRYCRVLPAK